MQGRVIAAAIGALVITGTEAARAEPPTSWLEWRRAAGAELCLSHDDLVHAVENRLQRRVFVGREEADWIVRGEIGSGPGGSGWTATLEVWDAQQKYIGTREIQSSADDCAPLSEALGLVLALVVESPTAHVTIYLPRPPPPAVRIVRIPSERPVRTAPAPADRLPPLEFDTEVGAVLGAGVMPGFGVGGQIGASLESQSWRSAVSAAVWKRAESESASGAVAVSAWQGEARLCPLRFQKSWFRIEPCGVVIVGRATGRGTGLSIARVSEFWFAEAGAGLDATFGIGRQMFARLGVGAALQLRPFRFYYLESDRTERNLWTTWPVAPFAGVGLGWRFL